MCGKDPGTLFGGTWKLGSPPHVRERPKPGRFMVIALGITPACAGKTDVNRLCAVIGWDHPRMCGKD